MTREETFDVVIIGAGHNGTSTAAYLAKSGLSVCVLEERPECGGGQETAEPIAGVRIQPHAIANYGGSAPGWEQLELWKYGFRMDWDPRTEVELNTDRYIFTRDGLSKVTEKDMMGWAKISCMLAGNDAFRDLMRATFWCPPHPPEVELDEYNIPFMQVYKQYEPDVWTRELLEMTMFDLMDEYLDTEPFKVTQAYIALSSGAHGHMEGVAIPAMCSSATVMPPAIAKPVAARGNMHGYFHALFRCATAHGAVFRACCPVEEIIISNGRATGVRISDDSTYGPKVIHARKAVISAAHIKHTFLNMIGPRHLDAGFLQRIKDLSLKGGSLFMSHYLTHEEFRYREKYRLPPPNDQFTGAFFNMESREIYFKNVENVLGRQENLTLSPDEAMWGMVAASLYDPTNPQCTRPGQHINGPLWMMVPTPEYNVDGMDAMDKENEKQRWAEFMRASLSCIVENLDDDNLIRMFTDSPTNRRCATPACSVDRGTGSAATVTSGGTNDPARALTQPRAGHRGALPGAPVVVAPRWPVPDGGRLQPDAHPHRGRGGRTGRLVVRLALVHPHRGQALGSRMERGARPFRGGLSTPSRHLGQPAQPHSNEPIERTPAGSTADPSEGHPRCRRNW
ncbi:MAG: FAD-dependent oxidoreductase [Microthrixaceae bacterium]|nr:FAD-dependent oxidoreductase [Microthrixaceae bacterium]